MRKCLALALLVAFSSFGGLTQDARAGVTIDVVFQDGRMPSSGISPGDAGPGCTFTGYYGHSVSWGHCMDVILTATDPIVDMSVSLNYDNDNGLAVGSVYEWKGAPVSWSRGAPSVKCAPSGGLTDTGSAIQSFDCAIPEPNNPPVLAAGTYRIGTIVWDTTALVPGSETLSVYLVPGLDAVRAVIDGAIVDVSASVVLGSYLLHTEVIPEPGTAALLGLGLVGLTLTARRRRGRRGAAGRDRVRD